MLVRWDVIVWHHDVPYYHTALTKHLQISSTRVAISFKTPAGLACLGQLQAFFFFKNCGLSNVTRGSVETRLH